MITINNLNKSFHSNKKVLNNLNLTLNKGLIHGIVGLNGAGKTTLLNCLFGIIKPDSGEILLENQKINKKHLAYLITENFFYSNITAREYLGLFKNEKFDIEEWNKLFALPLDQIIDGYSTGMKKKLALLGVLKQNKSYMILDEPFNGLDMETCRIIRMILLRWREKGKTIIITSHIMETLTNLCDHIHYLEAGKIKYSVDKSQFSYLEKNIFSNIENANLEQVNKLT